MATNNESFKRGHLKAGTFQSLDEASTFVRVVEERQGTKIGCIEEAAFHMGYIESSRLLEIADGFANSGYGDYLQRASNWPKKAVLEQSLRVLGWDEAKLENQLHEIRREKCETRGAIEVKRLGLEFQSLGFAGERGNYGKHAWNNLLPDCKRRVRVEVSCV